MPPVPTFGKNEQLFAAAVAPLTRPGPQGGWRCSSFEPAMRNCGSVGFTAIVGSFCLLVGKTAVVFEPATPATCGLFAWTSRNVGLAAAMVNPNAARRTAAMRAANLRCFRIIRIVTSWGRFRGVPG